MWKIVSQNVTGTSHQDLALPCQDSCRVSIRDFDDGELLVIACADGAGSATHAELGSALACEEFVRLAGEDKTLTANLASFDPEILVDWLREIRWSLSERALGLDVPIRQLATTMLGAVIGEHYSYFVQIGDGALVIRCGEVFGPVFWPQSGEYSNTTNFLTDEYFVDHIQVRKVEERIEECAVFTDGLERLILQFDTQTVHRPFLEPMLAAMRRVEDASIFAGPLNDFLSSSEINSRTDDDKTLVLATRHCDETSLH